MSRTCIVLFLTLAFFGPLTAQETDPHDGHGHHEHLWEVGLSLNAAYLFSESEWAPAYHVHVLRSLGHSHLAVGLGWEQILDDHGHRSIQAVLEYRPMPTLALSLAPGILFSGDMGESPRPNLHLELGYGWEFGRFHIGPSVGLASDSHEWHASAGLHLAMGLSHHEH